MSDILAFVRQFFSDSWRFFQITVPRTNITFAMLLIGVGLINVGFSALGLLLGVSLPSLGTFLGSRARYKDALSAHGVGQTRLPSHGTRYRVSPERIYDER